MNTSVPIAILRSPLSLTGGWMTERRPNEANERAARSENTLSRARVNSRYRDTKLRLARPPRNVVIAHRHVYR